MKYPTENQSFTATFHKNCCITKNSARCWRHSTAACQGGLGQCNCFPTTGWRYTQNKMIELWKTDSHMQSCCTQSWWWSFSQSLRSTWSRLGKSKSDLHLNTWRKGREEGQKWLGPAEIKHHLWANISLIYYSCSQDYNRCGGKSAVKILEKRKVHLESFFDPLHQMLFNNTVESGSCIFQPPSSALRSPSPGRRIRNHFCHILRWQLLHTRSSSRCSFQLRRWVRRARCMEHLRLWTHIVQAAIFE